MKIAINGLGRIGRCILRAVFEHKIDDVDIVAINGPADIDTHIHLLKYDSVHGTFDGTIEKEGGRDDVIVVNGRKIKLYKTKNVEEIDWKSHNIDVVMECTGAFTSKEKAGLHIKQGAKKVIISAPAKEKDVPTIVYKVNDSALSSSHSVISIGSCTTNALAPVALVLHENFKIEKGFMTTIHAYTNDQNNLDASHKDLRRARACALSMIPTSTGAAKALSLVIPELDGKLDGVAVRVPTPNVSMVDLCCVVEKQITREDINAAMKAASEGFLRGVLKYETQPLVSIDHNHTTFSSIFDSLETKVTGGNLVRIASWYDNEWAFSIRMLDVAKLWMH